MFRGRRWVAGLLVVLFSVLEVFASAPLLHVHPPAESAQGALQRVHAPLPQSERNAAGRNTTTTTDCFACRTLGLATTLISWIGVAPPAEHGALTLVASAVVPVPAFLDDARGRAPPAC